MTALIFDTETTGQTEPRLIEAAWVEVELDMTVKSKFCQRYNPGKPIEFGALATHHIMDEDLSDAPPYTDFRLPEGTEYLIGYNVDYDWRVIGEPPIRRICALALCRHLYPQADSHSQSAMLYYLNRAKARELLKDAHSALTDVMNCARILWRIFTVLEPEEKCSWEALWKFSEMARIPAIMPFGKHKGSPIRDLPPDYKRWLLGQPDVDPYLAQALRAA